MLNDVPEALYEAGVAPFRCSHLTAVFSHPRLFALAALVPARAFLFSPSHIKEVAP